MTTDTAKLRELLEKATPGPWKVVVREVMEDASVYPTHIVGGAAEFQVCLMESPNLAKLAMDDPNGWPASGKAREANTAYIAAANPAAVSSLLDELDMLREIEARNARLDKECGRLERENDRLRAELQATQWQPIETAPKDGTEIIVFHPEGGVCAAFCPAEGFAWHCMDGENTVLGKLSQQSIPRMTSFVEPPTHWMPLPPAPPQGERDDHAA